MTKALIRKSFDGSGTRSGDDPRVKVQREYDPDTAWIECLSLVGQMSGRLTAMEEKIENLSLEVVALRDESQRRKGAMWVLGILGTVLLSVAGMMWSSLKDHFGK